MIPQEEMKLPFKAYKGVMLSKVDNVSILKATASGNLKYIFQKENTCFNDDPLRLCANTGFHFSITLKDAIKHCGRGLSIIFYEIEVTGDFLLGKDKGITKQFTFIRQIPRDEIDQIIIEERIDEVLSTVRKIQVNFPYTVLGGSLALYLYGARLERFRESTPDIDISVPFFYGFENIIDKPDIIDNKTTLLHQPTTTNKNYDNDFDYSFSVDDTNIDVKVEPLQKYQVVSYKGFDYKVALLPVIIAAKSKYALNGNQKHNDDLLEFVTHTSQTKENLLIDNLPF